MNYGRGFPLPRHGKSGSSSWTPAKPTIQRSNLVVRDNPVNQVENENWGDLVGMYKDLLNEETLNLNKVAQDINTTNPPPTVQNQVVSTPNRNLNLNQILYSTPLSTRDRGSIQAPPSVSDFSSEGPSCWDGSLLDAIVRPKKSGMNYGRGFPLPRYGKSCISSWTPAKPTIQRSNLVVRDNPVNQVENENWDDLVGMYKDLLNEETLNLNKVAQDIYTTNPPPTVQNRVVSTPNRNLNLNQILYSTPVSTRDRGSIQAPPSVSYFSSEGPSNWDGSLLCAIVRPKKSGMNYGRGFPLPRYGKSGSSSWTPAKPTIQRSNLVVRDNPVNQVENENWGDLVGMYKDLLNEETLNLNKVAQDIYTTNPPPTVQYRVVSTPNRNLNLNQILYSTPVSTPNQAPPSDSYFPSEGPSNWDARVLDALVRPKKSSASEPFISGSQNSSVYGLNRMPVLNSSIQVGSNSGGTAQVGSMLGNQQSLLIGGYNSNQLPTDGFLVPYYPCYDLNSLPRSEHEAASSGITEPSLLAPITPDTRPKQIDNQWTPTKDGEDADNHYNIGDSTSSAVSTTLKEHLIAEKGDELGIDLNKTPNQMN